MEPFAARICQSLELLREVTEKLAEDGELSDDDVEQTICSLETIVAALHYELACRDEARDVACDRSACRLEA